MTNNLDLIAGASGMQIIDDTNAHTGNFKYFLPREDTSVNACTGVDADGNAVDFKTTQNWDGTLSSTDICIIPRGYSITSITLTSGSIQLF